MPTPCATQCDPHMPDAMPPSVPNPMRNAVHERTNEHASLASNVPAPATSRPHDEPEPDPATPDWPYPDGPTCEHGMPGGNQPDPVLGGRQACPQCARETARTTRSTR